MLPPGPLSTPSKLARLALASLMVAGLLFYEHLRCAAVDPLVFATPAVIMTVGAIGSTWWSLRRS